MFGSCSEKFSLVCLQTEAKDSVCVSSEFGEMCKYMFVG
jgi:hypothetical protein